MDNGNQTIKCNVSSCEHLGGNNLCKLGSIHVEAAHGKHTGTPDDESMCGSYRTQM